MSQPEVAKRRRRAAGAPTIMDVAKVANVSGMTVSRVINGDPRVREQTRIKVNEAIGSLNYTPNLAARSLAGAGQIRIMLIYGNPSSTYLSDVLVGALTEAHQSSVQLSVERIDDGETPWDIVQRLTASRTEGVILPPPYSDDIALVSALDEAGMLVANLAGGRTFSRAYAVAIDDAGAAREMTQHLLELGHIRIGFITGAPNQLSSGHRLGGYRTALTEAGLTVDPALVITGDFTYLAGLEAADQLFDLDNPPTAIFASNDEMALAVIAAAHKRGLDVPRDLSVSGFDDTLMATMVAPQLTTARQPTVAMAKEAVELLSKAIGVFRDRGERGHGQRLFDHEIVVRGSTGTPPRIA